MHNAVVDLKSQALEIINEFSVFLRPGLVFNDRIIDKSIINRAHDSVRYLSAVLNSPVCGQKKAVKLGSVPQWNRTSIIQLFLGLAPRLPQLLGERNILAGVLLALPHPVIGAFGIDLL